MELRQIIYVSVCMLIIIEYGIFLALTYIRNKRIANDEMLRFNADFSIEDRDFELLDKLIDETLLMYTAQHPNLLLHSGEPGYSPIEEDLVMPITVEVASMVLGRISFAFKSRLCMFIATYAFDDWILYKVKLKIIEFVINHNQ